MRNKKMKNSISYKIYLLDCLMQDIDGKIDNPPMRYNIFIKKLRKKNTNIKQI